MFFPGTAGILPALGNVAILGTEEAGKMPAIPGRHPILPPLAPSL